MRRIFTLFLLLLMAYGASGTLVATAQMPTVEQVKELLKKNVSILSDIAAKAARESNQEVAWNSSPDAIVLQLREGGGFRMAPSATELPQWTLYGDGMVIWTDDSTDATPGFTNAVWMGQLSEAEMYELLSFANQSGFWELEASYSINDESEVVQTENGEVLVQPQIMDLPSGRLRLNLKSEQHSVEIYPPNYEKMPNAYRVLRERLLQTRPAERFTYTPSSYRLEASRLGALDELAQGTRALLVEWTFNEINLELVSSTSQTIDSRKGLEMGKLLINNGYFIVQDGVGYEVKLFGNPPRPIK